MKKSAFVFVLAFSCVLTAFFSGCISYTGAVMPGDDEVDEANRPFAQKAAQDYAQRQQFKRDVIIQEADGMKLFLSPQYVPRSSNDRVNELCQNIEVRRAIAQSAKACLKENVLGLHDLKLVGENAPAMVSVQAVGNNATQSVYKITYNIANIDMQLRETSSILKSKEIIYQWVANASVEIQMIAPNGSAVFNFNAMGTASQTDDGSKRPNATMLEEAAVEGVKIAMKKYAVKFGPVLYVVETCQNGEFVRINAGTNYGIKAGMKIKFFRYREQEGLDGQQEAVETLVATGTVGAANAPLEENSAWVHIDGYDKKVPRSVFRWTSARVVQGEGSTGNIQLPGLSTFGL
ncbi:MAG TPA: hypothetical protein PK941_14305 [Paludibacter sp.]|mgnify:CR=1 FL=1|nr:hypothetical protein [Paludibacter sp.]